MIGTLRFVLASLVLVNHLYLPTANLVGAHAVAGFYVMSGYLMTKVIHEVYGVSAGGAARFLANRFLRIYPPYWVVLGVSLMLLWWFPATFAQTYPNMQLPATAYDFFRNVTLWDLPSAPQIVVPPAWTLTVEVFFYIAMVVLLSRHRYFALTWCVVSISIHVWLISNGASFAHRYGPVYAASIFFSVGALMHFYPRAFERMAVGWHLAWPGVAVFCVAPLLVKFAGLPFGMIGFYGPAVLFVPLLASILRTRPNAADRFLGDLAYPVFITHVFAAGIVRICFPTIQPLTLMHLLASVAVCLAVSVLMVRFTSWWLEPIRGTIRNPPVTVAALQSL